MKKLVAVLLAAALCAASFASCDKRPAAEGTMVVGVEGGLSGNFVEGIGENANDALVRELINGGCDIYEKSGEGEYLLNAAVIDHYTAELTADGGKTYVFTLKEDLKWSDGSSLTAADYVFAFLFYASPAWYEKGGDTKIGEGLIGYDAYRDGEAVGFAGVRLINELSFSLTLDAEVFPSYYVYEYMAVAPLSISNVAAGGSIEWVATGSAVSGASLTSAAAMMYDQERLSPTVTCGPYRFVSFTDGVAVCEVNEEFSGDMNGRLPTIKTIEIRAVSASEALAKVQSGEINLFCGITDLDTVATIADSGVGSSHHARSGYGAIAFHCDFGATQDMNVRHALAALIDRAAVVDEVLGGFGTTVDAEYCPSLWQYKKAALQLDGIVFGTAEANRYLDMTEWIYERDGKTPFDAAKATADGGYLRYNAAKQPLTLYHLGTSGNAVTDAVERQFAANAPLAGVKIIVERADYSTLRSHLYFGFELGDTRKYNSFNIGFNIPENYDPYNTLHSDWTLSRQNINQLADTEIDRLSLELRAVNAGDSETYLKVWSDYQKRFFELLPNLPLYTDYIYNIFSADLNGVETTPFTTWAETVCGIAFKTQEPQA